MAAQDRVEGSETNRTFIIVVAVAAALVIAGLFGLLMLAVGGRGGSAEATLQGAIREGSPQFEEYKSKIFLDDPEATEAKRALGDTVMTLQTTVRNITGKTLNGLEMRAAVVDYEGQPVKQRTVVVIPAKQPELAPNKTLLVQVMLDGMKDSDPRANIKMEVTAFRFKE